jgi:cytochrome c biogenesis factor
MFIIENFTLYSCHAVGPSPRRWIFVVVVVVAVSPLNPMLRVELLDAAEQQTLEE